MLHSAHRAVPSFTQVLCTTLQELRLHYKICDSQWVLMVDPNAFAPLTGRLRSFSLDFWGHVFDLAPALSSALPCSLVKLSIAVRTTRPGHVGMVTSACGSLLPALS